MYENGMKKPLRLRTDPQIVMWVVVLLAYGCPLPAIVKAFGFDERTVKNWWQRAGMHCQEVHEAVHRQPNVGFTTGASR